MIFAAGLGTRLKPLTDTCPKALVKVGGKPMLQHTIEHLIRHGFDEIIVNIHYLGNQIKDFLQQHNNFGIRIEISDETNEILETGGGLLKAQHFLMTQSHSYCVMQTCLPISISLLFISTIRKIRHLPL